MVHLRLTRAGWLAAERVDVSIDGFDPCRPLFGLARDEPELPLGGVAGP
jgi:hypothetical protein